MMKKFIVALVLLSNSFLLAQESVKKLYSAPNILDRVSNHKIIAVLPFKTSLKFRKIPKGYDEQKNKEEETVLSYNLQNNFYAMMSIKKEDFPIKVLNVEITNSILKENNMLGNLDSFTPLQIAKALQVDAVVYCDYTYTKTNSELGAMVNEYFLMSNKVALGEFTMSMYDATDGELFWSFNKTMKQEYDSYPYVIIERMFSKVGRNFPYRK
ncbi:MULTISPECIES: hypothetical protein [Flavobacterium]|uniref:Secreted protein n=1 Tax=Flavobacterium keumense TaxID=1306518 RepID=A0ABY8N988_9FLAO|nr:MULTISPECIES: hypothetical protein [Flavobacterium]WGK95156.1 hypothetical protein MG292_02695 [Flavobacterium keumense]